jgi:hypothetical protein
MFQLRARFSFRRFPVFWTALALALIAVNGGGASAQQHVVEEVLLAGEGDFRVRVHAALLLGKFGGESAGRALEHALVDDGHPAVRVAAAAALSRAGTEKSIPVLRKAGKDGSEMVREQARRAIEAIEAASAGRAAAPARSARPPLSLGRAAHLVMVGDMRDRSGSRDGKWLSRLRAELLASLGRLRNVVVVDKAAGVDDELETEIRRRGIPRLRVDANILRLEQEVRDGHFASHCDVSLMVMDDPDMVIRAVLRGSATSMDTGGARLPVTRRKVQARALRAAVTSALKNFGKLTGPNGVHADRPESRTHTSHNSVTRPVVALADAPRK